MTPPQRDDAERPVAALLAPDILALLDESPGDVAAETEELHPANLADIAETLPVERVRALLRALPAARAADVLEYLDEELRTEVLEAMSTRQAAALVTEMTPDDRADVLDELEEETAEEILAEIEANRDEHIHMPSPSYFPVVASFGAPLMAYGVVSLQPANLAAPSPPPNEIASIALIVVGALIALLGFFGWVLEPAAAEE